MTITRYITENSVYEHDEDTGMVRRVSGVSDPTPRTGTDGVWQSAVVTRGLDGSLILMWLNPVGRVTMTSPVMMSWEVDERGDPVGPRVYEGSLNTGELRAMQEFLDAVYPQDVPIDPWSDDEDPPEAYSNG